MARIGRTFPIPIISKTIIQYAVAPPVGFPYVQVVIV